jgi:hypothetical protein
MKMYEYDEAGLFVAEHELINEQIPEHFQRMTDIAPPELSERYEARWNGSDWTICVKQAV